MRGLAAMIVAVAALSLMDGGLKTLSPYYSPLQITSMRGLSALPITLLWVSATGGRINSKTQNKLATDHCFLLTTDVFSAVAQHFPLISGS